MECLRFGLTTHQVHGCGAAPARVSASCCVPAAQTACPAAAGVGPAAWSGALAGDGGEQRADVVLHPRGCRVTGSGAGDLVEQQASRKASNSAARQESRTPAGRQPVDHHGPDRGTRSPQDLAELGAVGRLQSQLVAGQLALTAGSATPGRAQPAHLPGQAPRTSRRRFRPGVIYATSIQILALQMSSNPYRCRKKGAVRGRARRVATARGHRERGAARWIGGALAR